MKSGIIRCMQTEGYYQTRVALRRLLKKAVFENIKE
jgi:hypothetical protein